MKMKKMLATVSALCMMCAVVPMLPTQEKTAISASAAEGDYILGDANGDGVVTIDDVVLVNLVILGKAEISEKGLKAIDFNKNGKPDSSDALVINNYLAGLTDLSEYEDYILGDANGDGVVTIDDAILVNQAILGKAELSEKGLKAIDFNKNGKPDASDILVINNYLAGLTDLSEYED